MHENGLYFGGHYLYQVSFSKINRYMHLSATCTVKQFRVVFGLRLALQPYPCLRPYMRFLFVRPEVCLHLPSDSSSRWTPLVFSYALPSTGRAPDFHPLDFAHAGRTMRACRKFVFCNRPVLLPGGAPLFDAYLHLWNSKKPCSQICRNPGAFSFVKSPEIKENTIDNKLLTVRIYSVYTTCNIATL